MVSPNTMRTLINDLADVKSKQNVPGALNIYHPDGEIITPSFNSAARGSKQLERELRIFFRLFPDYSIELEHFATQGNIALTTAWVSMTPSIPQHSLSSIRAYIPIEFHFRKYRISKEVFNLDLGIVCRQAGISNDKLWSAIKFHARAL